MTNNWLKRLFSIQALVETVEGDWDSLRNGVSFLPSFHKSQKIQWQQLLFICYYGSKFDSYKDKYILKKEHLFNLGDSLN